MTTTVDTTRRINLNRVSPEVYEAVAVLSNAAAKDIDPDLAELIKIRASQMNHCAFCLDMHTADARKRGINEQKLALLPAWEEAEGIFTEQEQAALALTEEMTDLTRQTRLRRGVCACGRGVLRARARSGHRDGADHQRLEPHRRDNPPAAAQALIRSRGADPVRCRDRRRRRRGPQAASPGHRPASTGEPAPRRGGVGLSADAARHESGAGRHAMAHPLAASGNRCAATRMRAVGRRGPTAGPAAR